jgi:hypothetical protein
MIMSVSILMIGSGAATPVSCVNLSMAEPLSGGRNGAYGRGNQAMRMLGVLHVAGEL